MPVSVRFLLVESELLERQNLEGPSPFPPQFLFRDRWRTGLPAFPRVARQHNAHRLRCYHSLQLLEKCRRFRSTNRMVAAPIEEELERWPQIRQLRDIGLHKQEIDPRALGLLSRQSDRQRAKVHRHHLETLLRQPDRVRSRPAADFDGSTRLDRILRQSPLQLRRDSPRVPWGSSFSIARVPVLDLLIVRHRHRPQLV